MAFPDDELVKSLLETRSFELYELLEKRRKEVITSKEILAASENNCLEEIVKKAKSIESSKVLFNDIYLLYEEQYLVDGKYINRYGKECFDYNIKYKIRTKNNSTLVGVYPSKGVSKKCLSACDYNDACRAKGLNQAGNYIAGGQGLD